MQHHRVRPPLALAAALLATPLLTGQTVVNVPCAKDNTLYQSAAGALSSGSGPALFLGVTGQPGLRRALLQFDVAAVVPAGAHIVSAELSINVTFTTFGGSLDVFGHRVLASWGEGASIASGGGGAPPRLPVMPPGCTRLSRRRCGPTPAATSRRHRA